jgi:hypothetical protein
MTDRELLELAAKAAGLEFDPTVQNQFGLLVVLEGFACQSYQKLWNPLTDDGDALRLAVKLGLSVLPTPEDVEVLADQHTRELHGETVSPWACESWTLKQQDPYAATRRAIVRAAAEIGKEKNT